MEILSHRGYWKAAHEKNHAEAFARSFDLGIGTETDIRDHNGRLVIAHDPPNGSELTFEAMLDILGDRDLPLALNIKADGLAPEIQAIMASRGLTRWFTFDMSGPELIRQLRLAMPAFTRMSEYERDPILLDDAAGVWLDAFEGEWFSVDDILSLLNRGKKVCLVSPELHGRSPFRLWNMIKENKLNQTSIMVCTDLPEAFADAMETARP